MKGRLFWKLWAAFWGVLFTHVGLTMFAVDQLREADAFRDTRAGPPNPADLLALEAQRLMETGGDLRVWHRSLEQRGLRSVRLRDEHGDDLLERSLPDGEIERGQFETLRAPSPSGRAERAAPPWPIEVSRTLFVPGREASLTLTFTPRGPGPAFAGGIVGPLQITMVIGLVVSGLVSFVLSRYLTQPIRALHHASGRVASGDFSVQVAPAMGRRRDELAELARRFDVTTLRLGRMMDTQKTLLRDVSHELRSPLARLQVALDLLKHRFAGQGAAELDRADKEVADLEGLIGEVLTLSRLDHDMAKQSRRSTDLLALVTEVVADADFEAAPADKGVVIGPTSAIVQAEIDPELVKRAIDNVVRNAVRHTAVGTDVQVSLEHSPDAATIIVRDLGPGVPESKLRAIFEPFHREGAPCTTNGHGIGLALAERVVAAHGGTVRADNHPSGGLVVSITLPIRALHVS